MADAVTLANGSNALIPDLAPHFQQLTVRIGAALLADLRADKDAMLRFARSAEERRHAQRILAQLLAMPDAWSLTRDLLLTLAAPMTDAGHRHEWMPVLVQGLVQSKANGDTIAAVDLSFQLGLLYQSLSNYLTSDAYLHESHSLAIKNGDRRNQARALNSLAFNARLRRVNDKAHELVKLAMQVAGEDAQQLGWSHMVLGCLAGDQGEWHTAIEHWQRSLYLYASINDQVKVAWRLRDLGLAHLALKEYATAISYHQRAIATCQEQANPLQTAVAQMNLGNVYVACGQATEALPLYWQAEEIFRQLADQRHLAMVYNNIAFAYDQTEAWQQAEQTYHSSIERWQMLDEAVSLANAMVGLGVVYLRQKCYEQAVSLFNQALSHVVDSVQPAGIEKAQEIRRHIEEAQTALQQKP